MKEYTKIEFCIDSIDSVNMERNSLLHLALVCLDKAGFISPDDKQDFFQKFLSITKPSYSQVMVMMQDVVRYLEYQERFGKIIDEQKKAMLNGVSHG